MKHIISALIMSIPLTVKAYDKNTYKAELYSYGGLPVATSTSSSFKILVNTAYAVGYSEALQNPLWCCYRLGNSKGDITKLPVWERPQRFEVDYRTESRVSHDDYTGSGFHRGHLAPNSAIGKNYGQMAVLETYFMTNIMPQTPQLNSGPWQKMEEFARKHLSQKDDKNEEIKGIFVITGPIFDGGDIEKIKDTEVAIPTHCYKIYAYRIGYRGTVKAVAFIMPQDIEESGNFDKYYRKYLTNVHTIEQKTGLNFYPLLSLRKQYNLESKIRTFEFSEISR